MVNRLAQLAKIVSRERLRRGWTQKELAAEAKIGDSTLERIEQARGKMPSERTLQKIARALNCFYDTDHHRFEPIGVLVPLTGPAFTILTAEAKHLGHSTLTEWLEVMAAELAAGGRVISPDPKRLSGGGGTAASRTRELPQPQRLLSAPSPQPTP